MLLRLIDFLTNEVPVEELISGIFIAIDCLLPFDLDFVETTATS
jgi:hypothetical protein